MTSPKPNMRALNAAVEATISAMRANDNDATRAAYTAAWAARNAARPQSRGPRDNSAAARSGRRQHAEQAARTAEAMRRKGAR